MGKVTRISIPVEPSAMVAHNSSHMGITIDVLQDPLADDGMLLHHGPLVPREGSWFFENPSW